MRHLLAVIVFALSTGCAATYQHADVSAPTARLERAKGVLIATPKPGAYGKTEYPASGDHVAVATRSAFARFANRVDVSSCVDLPCLITDGGDRYGYFAVPQILHWEDRNTEWSGIPDRMEIKVTIFDAQTQNAIASTVITGKSKWMTLGGDHPQDLLPVPLTDYVSSLYSP